MSIILAAVENRARSTDSSDQPFFFEAKEDVADHRDRKRKILCDLPQGIEGLGLRLAMREPGLPEKFKKCLRSTLCLFSGESLRQRRQGGSGDFPAHIGIKATIPPLAIEPFLSVLYCFASVFLGRLLMTADKPSVGSKTRAQVQPGKEIRN